MECQVYAHAEIGGKHDGVFLCGSLNRSLARIVKTGCADNHLDAFGGTFLQKRQGGIGAGEINQHVGIRQSNGGVVGNGHACFDACGIARIQAQRVRTCLVQRAREPRSGVAGNCLHQHSAHAPVCACDGDFHLFHKPAPYLMLPVAAACSRA